MWTLFELNEWIHHIQVETEPIYTSIVRSNWRVEIHEPDIFNKFYILLLKFMNHIYCKSYSKNHVLLNSMNLNPNMLVFLMFIDHGFDILYNHINYILLCDLPLINWWIQEFSNSLKSLMILNPFGKTVVLRREVTGRQMPIRVKPNIPKFIIILCLSIINYYFDQFGINFGIILTIINILYIIIWEINCLLKYHILFLHY
jgi:hypothetical protein